MEPDQNQTTQNSSLSPNIETSPLISPLPIDTEGAKAMAGLEFQKHPMFINHRQDEILSFLIEIFEAAEFPMTGFESVKYTNGQFKNHLFYHMFGKYGETAESLHESKIFEKPKKTVCAEKIIGPNVYIKCLDCELASKTPFCLCADCYDKEKHKDHRVCQSAIPKGSFILCGCGQGELLPPERFCNRHTAEAFGWEEALAIFPPEYLERYKTVVKKAFYGFRSLFEIAGKISHEMTKIVLLKFADQIFCEIIAFCEECQSTISQGFLSVFMDIMKDSFLDPYNRFWKDCDAQPGPIEMEQSFACKCSILGRILQVILFLQKEFQAKFGMIIFACVKNEKFREFFVLEYTKYFGYLYTREYKHDTHPDDWRSHFVSTLANLETHFFWNREDLLVKILKAGNFAKILLPLKRLFSAQRPVTTSVDCTITRAMHTIGAFIYPKMKISANLLITEFEIMHTFLNFLRATEINFGCEEHLYLSTAYEEVQFEAINRVMQCELQIRPALDLLAFHLANNMSSEDEKSVHQKKFIKDWYELLKKTKADLASEDLIPRIFAPGLERAVLSILWSHMKDEIDLGKLEIALAEGLPPEVKIEEVAENIIEAVLKFFGMVRFITVQYHLDKGPIYALYYNQMHNLFEIDVMVIQLMTAWIQPEKLFKILTEKFFGNNWGIADFLLHFSSEKHCGSREPALMRDFLEFLLFLMKDEVSYFNLRVRYADMATDGKFDATARDQFITQQVIRDTLAGVFSAQYFGIKNFFAQVFRKSPQLDASLRETTVLDEVGQNIRLKPELQTEYDSTPFYKFPSIEKVHNDGVLAKFSKKDKTFDMVSGRYDSTAPKYLKAIQRNMFQSSLVDFLGSFIQDFSEKCDFLLQSVLRLILMNLYVLEDALESQWERAEILKSKVKEHYLNGECFMENLNRISKESKYEDCYLCISKIKDLLQKIFSTEEFEKTETVIEEVQETKIDKKQLALDRMNKLKEEIAKKQALFVEKNLEEIQKSPEKISHHVCQFCLEEVDNDNEDFGLPIYIGFTNNLHNIESPILNVKLDYSDLSKVAWWPVITSCNHHYHKKCFIKLNQNINNQLNRHLLSQVESTCLLCKSLCNNFLCLNDSKNSGFIGNLSQDMSLILSEFKGRMLNILNVSRNEITEREIFRRTYEYLTETYHVYEKPETLKSIFDLYTSVLRSLKASLTNEEKQEIIGQQGEEISLMEETFGNENPSSPLRATPESSFTKIFTKILLLIPEQELQAKHQLVLAQYLTFKVMQLILYEKLEEVPVSFTDCMTYFMTHKAFQAKVIKETTHFIKRIIFTAQLNECTLNKQPDLKLFELLCSLKSDEEYLSELLRFIGINSSSFEEAVCGLLGKCEKGPLNEILMASLSTQKQGFGNLQGPPSRKLAPKLVKLPLTYAEFVDKYFDVRCSLCNKISPILNGCLCLICGDLICGSTCDFIHKGNLNQHAKDYHMGVGYFLDRSSLKKLLINTPVNCNLNGKGVYIDEFGQMIIMALQNAQEIYKVDYKKYLLNPASEQEDKEIINYYSLPRACFREATASQINHPPGSF